MVIKKNKLSWSPTSWQKKLPPIIVKEEGKEIKYTFQSLINADGYLCPGSARAYKTLQTALPLLYTDKLPEKGDFAIVYGPSKCTAKVFTYFLGKNYQSKKYLILDTSARGREHMIIRISTGVRVHIIYEESTAQGHNSKGAQAGDIILKARDKIGMAVRVLLKSESIKKDGIYKMPKTIGKGSKNKQKYKGSYMR